MFWATQSILHVVSGVKDIGSTSTNQEYQHKPAVLSNSRPLGMRFIAARFGSKVTLNCYSSSPVSWYKETENGKRQELVNNPRIEVESINSSSVIKIKKLQLADSGTYFCENKKREKQLCCGTELKVMGISTFEQVKSRNTLKDTIILIQTVLLVLFVSIPVFLTLGKDDSKKAPEDHTYEGLTVELADTYEDIGTYQDKAEKWDLAEHPSEE
ncbi:B-cell antigen receptor complex-associated protein beta chain [Tiliqua scincoides]|uniref:B-cell antigen receptor complex-associated protein beta chain n=1 Tax=Tiliqua scincoides TaxID=71010 RepID=UPI003463108D